MAGVQLEITLQGIEGAAAALGRLAATDLDDLAYNAGGLLESTARERIASEKVAPDGTPWDPWSDRYARTRKSNHSLLIATGALSGGATTLGVQNYTTGSTVKIGANAVYAAIHQMGGQAGRGRKATIPARPYLGLSEHDRRAITDLVHETIREVLQ